MSELQFFGACDIRLAEFAHQNNVTVEVDTSAAEAIAKAMEPEHDSNVEVTLVAGVVEESLMAGCDRNGYLAKLSYDDEEPKYEVYVAVASAENHEAERIGIRQENINATTIHEFRHLADRLSMSELIDEDAYALISLQYRLMKAAHSSRLPSAFLGERITALVDFMQIPTSPLYKAAIFGAVLLGLLGQEGEREQAGEKYFYFEGSEAEERAREAARLASDYIPATVAPPVRVTKNL